MNIFIYDKSFEGLLTVVYESYARKIVPQRIQSNLQIQNVMWCTRYDIPTDTTKSNKVWNGLRKKITEEFAQAVFRAFLSETPGIEMIIYRYLRKIFDYDKGMEYNFADPDILTVAQLSKKVAREAQRIQMFVRFQKTSDQIYFAAFEPMYDVLPIVIDHFTERFADQLWVIFDVKRKYGYFYDLEKTVEIKLNNQKFSSITGKLNIDITDISEEIFQNLWKQYFKSISIEERKNPTLQKQFLPKRFWKFLPEKSSLN